MNFTKAAEKLYIPQPAVSRYIAALEKELGVALFARESSRSISSDRIYDCYFHADLRVYDVSDPYVPKEIAYFIPPDPEELCFELEMANKPFGTTEDCVVDDRGYIYVNTMHDGLYILRVPRVINYYNKNKCSCRDHSLSAAFSLC